MSEESKERMAKKHKSEAIAAVRETMEGLVEAGVLEKADMTDVEEEPDVEDLLQYLIAKCRYESLEAHHEETKEVLARIEESIHPIITRLVTDYEAEAATLNEWPAILERMETKIDRILTHMSAPLNTSSTRISDSG
jgi:predicted HicB family RNase H-like nuclease